MSVNVLDDRPAFAYNSSHISMRQELRIGLTTVDTILAVTVLIHTAFPFVACVRSKDFQRSYNKWVFSLTLANIIMGLSLFYHAVAYWTTELNMAANKFFCLGQIFVFYVGFFAQNCSLFFLALDRCLTLRYPLHAKLISNRLSDVCTSLLWLYALVIAVLPLVWLNTWVSPVQCYQFPVLHQAYIFLVLAHIVVFVFFIIVVTILMDRYIRVNLAGVSELYQGDVDAGKYTHYVRRTSKMAAALVIFFCCCYFPFSLVLSMLAGKIGLQHLFLLQFVFYYVSFLFPAGAPLIIMLMDPFLRDGAESVLFNMESRLNNPTSIHDTLTQKNPHFNSRSYSNVFAKKVTALSKLNPKESPHPVPLQGIFW